MDEDRQELLRMLFAEATVWIETAHESAVTGQSTELAADDYMRAARRLRAAAQDLAALAEAMLAIIGTPEDD